jgi:hypothetical protein
MQRKEVSHTEQARKKTKTTKMSSYLLTSKLKPSDKCDTYEGIVGRNKKGLKLLSQEEFNFFW